jgi:hypothetical protein
MALNKEVEDVKSLARKAGLEITDLSEAPHKESAGILGNPTLLLSMLSVAPEGEEPRKEKLREITIGEGDGGLIKVDEGIFGGFVSVKKGTEEERNYLAQVILEDAIMDAGPFPLILDFSKRSLKLDEPNPYPYDYSRYGLSSHNVAFKVRRYDLSSDQSAFRVNLNQMDPKAVWRLFGLGTDAPSAIIMQAVSAMQKSGSIDGIGSIMEAVEKSPAKSDRDRFAASRALGMLRAVGKAYGGLFSKDFDTASVMAGWLRGSEPVHVSMHGLDQRKRMALAYCIVELFREMKLSPKSSEVDVKRIERVFLAMLGLDWLGSGLLQSEMTDIIISDYRGGLFSCEGDLPMQIESRISHRFNIIGAGRAKLYLTGRGTEFNVRPLLSCPP